MNSSPIIDEGYYVDNALSMLTANTFEFSFDGGQQSRSEGAFTRSRCSLSDDGRILDIYTDYTRSSRTGNSLKDFRVTYHNNAVMEYRIDKVLYSEDVHEVQTGEELSEQELSDRYVKQLEKEEKARRENGVTEDECLWLEHEGKSVYAKGERKMFELPFDISFDISQSITQSIDRKISADSAPNTVREYTKNAEAIISPMGVYFSGDCDAEDIAGKEDAEDKCFVTPRIDGSSKVVMEDGTVYYLLSNLGGERRSDDSGTYYETIHLDYSPTAEMQLDRGCSRIMIDIDKAQSVIVNSDTIYQT